MANYSIELRHVIDAGYKIFDFKYPFYDETKRKEFEEKFIKHFYFREIGCDTIDRFKWHLEDKMNTVFPYYNELFKSASIEYDVLDNYKLTETYTRNVERNDKQAGVSSTVGRVQDSATTETDENKTVDSSGNVIATGNDKDNETGKQTTVKSGTTNTENNETVNETHETDKDSNVKDMFLDTPQGKLDLTNMEYLTSLTQKVGNESESGTNNRTSNGSSDTETDETSTTDTTRNATRETEQKTDTTGNEKTVGKVATVSEGEQKTTQDNNTRMYSNGESKEEYTLVRRGNIGVDTDSDAIEKHNRLQKTLRNIERMFFDECEDLFMLVW